MARLPPVGSASQQQTQTQTQQTQTQHGAAAGAGGVQQLLVLMPEGASSGSSGSTNKGQLAHAQALGVPVLSQKWLMDCVSSMQLLPMEGFKV